MLARTQKQSKCLSTDKRIKKIPSIYPIDYYSAIGKNEIMPFAATRMGLKMIILIGMSQTQKDKYI